MVSEVETKFGDVVSEWKKECEPSEETDRRVRNQGKCQGTGKKVCWSLPARIRALVWAWTKTEGHWRLFCPGSYPQCVYYDFFGQSMWESKCRVWMGLRRTELIGSELSDLTDSLIKSRAAVI